jgi:hypothetical protein
VGDGRDRGSEGRRRGVGAILLGVVVGFPALFPLGYGLLSVVDGLPLLGFGIMAVGASLGLVPLYWVGVLPGWWGGYEVAIAAVLVAALGVLLFVAGVNQRELVFN